MAFWPAIIAVLLAHIGLVLDCAAADTSSSDTPMVEVTIADVPRVRAHVEDSIYGTTWKLSLCQPLRMAIAEAWKKEKNEFLGLDHEDLAAWRSVRFQLLGLPTTDEGASPFLFQADYGNLGAALFSTNSVLLNATPVTVPGADQAAAMARTQGQRIFALFGNTLMVANATPMKAPGVLPAGRHDAALTFDLSAFVKSVIQLNGLSLDRYVAHAEKSPLWALLAQQNRAAFYNKWGAAVRVLKPYLARLDMQFDVANDGIHQHSDYPAQLPWLKAADTNWCQHFPNGLLECGGIGIDGKVLWKQLVHPILQAFAKAQEDSGEPVDDLEEATATAMADAGLPLTLADVIGGIDGTFFAAFSSGTPFPTVTIGVPSTPVLDQFAQWALKHGKIAPPAPGASILIPVPGLPVPIFVLHEDGHWIVTSDVQLSSGWNIANADAWKTSAIGKCIAAQMRPGTCAFSVDDFAAIIRATQGYVGLWLDQSGLKPVQQMAIMQMLSQLSTQPLIGCQTVNQDSHGLSADGDGLIGGASFCSIVFPAAAASMISEILGPSFSADQSRCAILRLRTQVFPAEAKFQAGSYRVRDGGGTGSFGFFSELSGGPIPGSTQHASLLESAWSASLPTIQGYKFTIFLPDGAGGAIAVEDEGHALPKPVAGKKAPGSEYVAYAWPEHPWDGDFMFAITSAGEVYYKKTSAGNPMPAWNDLFGARNWAGKPTWHMLKAMP